MTKQEAIDILRVINPPHVLNILSETVDYDGADCDGSCLMEDINYWFFDVAGRYLDE